MQLFRYDSPVLPISINKCHCWMRAIKLRQNFEHLFIIMYISVNADVKSGSVHASTAYSSSWYQNKQLGSKKQWGFSIWNQYKLDRFWYMHDYSVSISLFYDFRWFFFWIYKEKASILIHFSSQDHCWLRKIQTLVRLNHLNIAQNLTFILYAPSNCTFYFHVIGC